MNNIADHRRRELSVPECREILQKLIKDHGHQNIADLLEEQNDDENEAEKLEPNEYENINDYS